MAKSRSQRVTINPSGLTDEEEIAKEAAKEAIRAEQRSSEAGTLDLGTFEGPQPREEGDFVLTPTGERAPILSKPGGQSRREFIGETIQRRATQERLGREAIAAAQRMARTGAKTKLDTENLRMGYTPSQERQLSTLRDVRAKIEDQTTQGRYTTQDRDRLLEQVAQQETGILPQMINKPPSAQEQYDASVIQTSKGPALYNPKTQSLDFVDEGPDMSFKEFTEGRNALATAMEVDLGEGRFGPAKKEDVDRQFAQNIQDYADFQRVLRGGDGGVGQAPQPQVAPGTRPADIRRQPAQPAAKPSPVAPVPKAVDVASAWKAGFAELQAKSGKDKPPVEDVDALAQNIMAELVQSGVTVDEAIQQVAEQWEIERDRGRLNFQLNFRRLNIKGIKQALEIERLKFLRAKAGQ